MLLTRLPACFHACLPNPSTIPALLLRLLQSSFTLQAPQSLSTLRTPTQGLGPLARHHQGASTNTEHPKFRFVPLSGFPSPSAVYSAPRLCGLSHPHTTSRVPIPVQGLSVSWLPSLIDSNFPPCRFLTQVLRCRSRSKPKPRDSEVFTPTESRTAQLLCPPVA